MDMNKILAIAFAWINALLAFALIIGGAVLGYNAVAGELVFVPFIGPLLERAPRVELRDAATTRVGMTIIGAIVGFVVASFVCGVFAVMVSIEKSLRAIAARY
jgi:hypothetical protein